MNENLTLLNKFYAAFGNLDYQTMNDCYHPTATFEDPAFGKLNAEEVKAMWKMLLSNAKAKDFSLIVEQVSTDGEKGTGDVSVHYLFSLTGRKVINHIHGSFRFRDGKIIEHKDCFNLWKWSRQALGISGWLLGWTPFFQKEIQKKARDRLNKFIMNTKQV